MNSAQTKILRLGIAVAVLALLFPPFKYPYHNFSGFHFALLPKVADGDCGSVDESYLLSEILVIGGATFGLIQSKKPT